MIYVYEKIWRLSTTALGLHVYGHYFQTSSPKLLEKSKPNFMKSIHGKEYINGQGHMNKMCANMIKTFTIFSRIRSPMMKHRRLKLYKFYINDDLGLTLTYVRARSNLFAL